MSFPPMLDAAMISIHHKHECHFVSVARTLVQLTSTSFLQIHLQELYKAPQNDLELNTQSI